MSVTVNSNEILILTLFKQCPLFSFSTFAISQRTGLGCRRVGTLVKKLMDKGLLIEAGAAYKITPAGLDLV